MIIRGSSRRVLVRDPNPTLSVRHVNFLNRSSLKQNLFYSPKTTMTRSSFNNHSHMLIYVLRNQRRWVKNSDSMVDAWCQVSLRQRKDPLSKMYWAIMPNRWSTWAGRLQQVQIRLSVLLSEGVRTSSSSRCQRRSKQSILWGRMRH